MRPLGYGFPFNCFSFLFGWCSSPPSPSPREAVVDSRPEQHPVSPRTAVRKVHGHSISPDSPHTAVREVQPKTFFDHPLQASALRPTEPYIHTYTDTKIPYRAAVEIQRLFFAYVRTSRSFERDRPPGGPPLVYHPSKKGGPARRAVNNKKNRSTCLYT